MKKILLVLVLSMFVLVACSSVAQSNAVQLPEPLVIALGMVVMVVITNVFKWLGEKLGGADLSDQAKIIAAALSSILVLGINFALALVPAAYDNFLYAILSFLIVLLGGTGAYSFWKRIRS